MTIRGPLNSRISNDSSPTTSGAFRTGVAAIVGLLSGNPTNVQAALADIVSQLANKVSTSRLINAGVGLVGGGSLSTDRTLSLADTPVAPGTYTLATVTVDQKGRLSGAASGSAGAVPDASTTAKGASKLSAAPTSATDPIAIGTNDAKMSEGAAGAATVRTLGTTSTSACAGNDSRLLKQWEAVFEISGTLPASKPGLTKYKLPSTGSPTITEVTISVNTLPTTQNVIVDVNSVSNSTNARTTLYSTQANRPQIAPGGNYSNAATLPNTTSLSPGTEIVIDLDQAGSGVLGADLVIVIRGTY